MTVKEAKTHGCVKDPNNQACIANQCMAWRWFDPDTKSEGYCGLAGKEGAE